MPEFYLIIARKIFSPFWGSRAPLYTPPVSYAYANKMLIVNFTNIPVSIVGKCPWAIDIGHAADDVT